MTQESSLKQDLAEGFDSWNSEKPKNMVVLVLQVLDALELLQQVVLEGSWQWEEALMKLIVVQPADKKTHTIFSICSEKDMLRFKQPLLQHHSSRGL